MASTSKLLFLHLKIFLVLLWPISNASGRKRNFNLIGLSSSILLINSKYNGGYGSLGSPQIRGPGAERMSGGPSSSLHLHILVSLAQRAWLKSKISVSTGFEEFNGIVMRKDQM